MMERDKRERELKTIREREMERGHRFKRVETLRWG